MKLNFNHSEETFCKAIGSDVDTCQSILERFQKSVKEILTSDQKGKLSRLVEDAYNNFSKEEIAILLVQYVSNLSEEREKNLLMRGGLDVGEMLSAMSSIKRKRKTDPDEEEKN